MRENFTAANERLPGCSRLCRKIDLTDICHLERNHRFFILNHTPTQNFSYRQHFNTGKTPLRMGNVLRDLGMHAGSPAHLIGDPLKRCEAHSLDFVLAGLALQRVDLNADRANIAQSFDP